MLLAAGVLQAPTALGGDVDRNGVGELGDADRNVGEGVDETGGCGDNLPGALPKGDGPRGELAALLLLQFGETARGELIAILPLLKCGETQRGGEPMPLCGDGPRRGEPN